MKTKIWQTSVYTYNASGEVLEKRLLHFAEKAHVFASIEKSFDIIHRELHYVNMQDNSIVYAYRASGRVAVESIEIDFELLEAPRMLWGFPQ